MAMKFEVRTPFIDELDTIFLWMDKEIGLQDKEWTWDMKWSSGTTDGYDLFMFKHEEDKFMFILRWL